MNIHKRKLIAALTAFYAVTSGVSSTRCGRVAIVLAALFVGTLFATESFAITLNPATFRVDASGTAPVGDISGTAPGTLTNSYCNTDYYTNGGCENSMGTATAGLAVSAGGSSSGGVYAPSPAGDGQINFSFTVTGPGSVFVPLIGSGSVSTSASGSSASAGASISYSTYTGNYYYGVPTTGNVNFDMCSSSIVGHCGTNPQSGILNSSFLQLSNALGTGELQAGGGASGGSSSFSAQVSGFTLGIDPAWLASNPGYSLLFSPNITSVPPPAAFWLFGSGMIGLIGTARRKKLSD